MTATTVPTPTRDAAAATVGGHRRLRAVLTVNAATSFATGVAAIVAADWWSDVLGLGSPGWTRLVGVGLVLFAVDVALLARRVAGDAVRTWALAVSMADLAWVAATAVVVATIDLTTAGRIVAVAVGLGVLDLALLQLWLRHRRS